MDGQDARLKVVSATEVFVESHANDSSVGLHVDTLSLGRTLLGHLHHFSSLVVDGADGTYTSQLGCTVHRPSEDVEEHEEQNEAKEHNAHAHEGHGNAVGVFLLKLLDFVVVVGNVWSIGSDLICLKHLPFCIVDASKT